MARKKQENCLYFLVDFDIHPNLLSRHDSGDNPEIVHYKDGKIVLNFSDNDHLEQSETNKIPSNVKKSNSRKDLNILLLGQSGVGKSTWINSIVNYLHYETFEDAKKGGAICVIPSTFIVTDENGKEQLVSVGDADPNEVGIDGKLATQGPKTCSFEISDVHVRITDTPGLGANIDRNRENMKLILDHISHLREIHGICILMKPKHSKIGVFDISDFLELLSYFHKNAIRNIFVCFTNSRSWCYSLHEMTKHLDLFLTTEISRYDLLENRRFCLDIETFRFLSMSKYPNLNFLKGNDSKIAGKFAFEISWEKSATETKKLFDIIKELPLHSVTDSIAICNTRYKILKLTKSMVEISQSISTNLSAIADQEKSMKDLEESIDELAKKLYIPQITMESVPLKHPRTVCTNSKCVEVQTLDQSQLKKIEYVTHCHRNCTCLKDATAERYPNQELINCWAMNGNTNCRVCGCGWKFHMYITHNQMIVETKIINKLVETEMINLKLTKEKVEEGLNTLRAQNVKYNEEVKKIMEISEKFGAFLKENATIPCNYYLTICLVYLIQQEEIKVRETGADDDLLINLKEMMTRYEEERETLKEYMNETMTRVTQEDIRNLEKQLYALGLTGEKIKKDIESVTKLNEFPRTYYEKLITIEKCGHA